MYLTFFLNKAVASGLSIKFFGELGFQDVPLKTVHSISMDESLDSGFGDDLQCVILVAYKWLIIPLDGRRLFQTKDEKYDNTIQYNTYFLAVT